MRTVLQIAAAAEADLAHPALRSDVQEVMERNRALTMLHGRLNGETVVRCADVGDAAERARWWQGLRAQAVRRRRDASSAQRTVGAGQTPAAHTRRLQPAPRSPTDRRGATNTKDEALLPGSQPLSSDDSSEAPDGSAARRATGAALADPSGLSGQAHNYEAAKAPS